MLLMRIRGYAGVFPIFLRSLVSGATATPIQPSEYMSLRGNMPMAAIIDALRSVRAGVLPQRTSLHTASRPGLKPLAPAPKFWGALILVGFAALFLGAWWVLTPY